MPKKAVTGIPVIWIGIIIVLITLAISGEIHWTWAIIIGVISTVVAFIALPEVKD
jgi:hypothetical protein